MCFQTCDLCSLSSHDYETIKDLTLFSQNDPKLDQDPKLEHDQQDPKLEHKIEQETVMLTIQVCNDCFTDLRNGNDIVPILDKDEEQPDWLYLKHDKATLDVRVYESFAQLSESEREEEEQEKNSQKFLYGFWKNKKIIDPQLIQSLTGENNYGSSTKWSVLSRDWSKSNSILIAFRSKSSKAIYTISPVPSKYTRSYRKITDCKEVWATVEEILDREKELKKEEAEKESDLAFIVTDNFDTANYYSDPNQHPDIKWFDSLSELEKSRWMANYRDDLDAEDTDWYSTPALGESYINHQIKLRDEINDKIKRFSALNF